MGSAKEFKDMIAFVATHKIMPVIDSVLEGLPNAHKGFVSVAQSIVSSPCRSL